MGVTGAVFKIPGEMRQLPAYFDNPDLMFLVASIIKLHINSAYVHPVQPLATSLNNCT